jgi:hypothetical protein
MGKDILEALNNRFEVMVIPCRKVGCSWDTGRNEKYDKA